MLPTFFPTADWHCGDPFVRVAHGSDRNRALHVRSNRSRHVSRLVPSGLSRVEKKDLAVTGSALNPPRQDQAFHPDA